MRRRRSRSCSIADVRAKDPKKRDSQHKNGGSGGGPVQYKGVVEVLEARVGVEPTNDGFADHSLRPLGYRAPVCLSQNLCPMRPILAYYPPFASL